MNHQIRPSVYAGWAESSLDHAAYVEGYDVHRSRFAEAPIFASEHGENHQPESESENENEQ